MLEVRQYLCTGCAICTRVCPSMAISLRNGKAEIDFERCVDCHACANVCPTHAIRQTHVGDVEILRRRVANLRERIHQISGRLNRLA